MCTFSKALQAEYKAKGILIQVRSAAPRPWGSELWARAERGTLPPAGLTVHVQAGGGRAGVLVTNVVTAVPPLSCLLPPSPRPCVLEQETGSVGAQKRCRPSCYPSLLQDRNHPFP